MSGVQARRTAATLPSSGDQVLLANNEPLCGDCQPASTIPMMRTTGVSVDAAGNLWSVHNWKPDCDVDDSDPNQEHRRQFRR